MEIVELVLRVGKKKIAIKTATDEERIQSAIRWLVRKLEWQGRFSLLTTLSLRTINEFDHQKLLRPSQETKDKFVSLFPQIVADIEELLGLKMALAFLDKVLF